MEKRITNIQTNSCLGSFKMGDMHPIYQNRIFYQYGKNNKEVWLKEETYQKIIAKQKNKQRKRMALLRKTNPEYVKKHKGKISSERKLKMLEKKKIDRKDEIKGPAIRKKEMHKYYNNSIHRIGLCMRARLRDALKKYKKSTSTEKLVGCSFSELKRHIESKFINGMSWDNYGQWHIDHIIPCVSFNLIKEEEQRKCFNFSNLQPLWTIDNLRKGSKICVS